MQYLGYGIVECQVLCEDNSLADLGIDSQSWVTFAFDLGQLHSVKPNDEPSLEEYGASICHVFLNQGCEVVDTSYRELVTLWVAYRRGKLRPDCETSQEREDYEKENL